MIYEIDYDVPNDRVLLDGGALRYARKSKNMTARELADADIEPAQQLHDVKKALLTLWQDLDDVRQMNNIKVTMDTGGFAYGAYKATEYAQKRLSKAYKDITGEDLP